MGVQGLGLISAGAKPEFGARQKPATAHTRFNGNSLDGFGLGAYKSYVAPQIRFGSLLSQQPLNPRVAAFAQKQPFKLDPFQTNAMNALATGKSVVVPTPTSSGKTLIGEFAIADVLNPDSPNHGKKLAYTTPRKALSNEKYEDLVKQYGADNVGLMTGDVTINRNAPVLVMTTEVLRNMFYDQDKTDDEITGKLQYAVFDECHFIDDPDRGVVWEESMLYVPKHIQQVHLSATVENAEQYTDWLNQINGGNQFQLIPYETHDPQQQAQGRPVPLQIEYLSPEGKLATVLTGRGGQNPAFKRAFQEGRFDIVKAVDKLRDAHRLPAIFFAFGRNTCETYAGDTARVITNGLTTPEEQQKINIIIDRFKKAYPWLDKSPLLTMLPKGIGYHHGGMLPYEKKLVEVLMKKGLLKTVFATDTLAAGINVPARTVVLTTYDRNIDGILTPISNSDYQQIIGRAGRRGMYDTGYAVMMHPRDNNKGRIVDLAQAGPNAVHSQFRVTPGMALNLIETRSPHDIESMLDRTFATYQDKNRAKPMSNRKAKRQKGAPPANSNTAKTITAFRQMRRYLQKTGFLTNNKNIDDVKTTPVGQLAALLPTEHNLLIAKAAAQGVFDALTPAQLAGVLSSTVSQSKKPDPEMANFKQQPDEYNALTKMEETRTKLLTDSVSYSGIDLPGALGTDYVNIIERWCKSGDFNEILGMPGPGDVVNVIRRTANLLRHIADSNLDDTKYGALKTKARDAEKLLLADPLPAMITPQLVDTDL